MQRGFESSDRGANRNLFKIDELIEKSSWHQISFKITLIGSFRHFSGETECGEHPRTLLIAKSCCGRCEPNEGKDFQQCHTLTDAKSHEYTELKAVMFKCCHRE